jgi:release factor glutamine methyltransferase
MSSEASDWTIGKLLDWTARHLLESGISEARLDTEILLATAIQGRRIDLYAQHTRSATAEERARFREMVRRRLQHEPVAYITGKREFYGLELKVNNRVLVPRPETELVVDEARAWLKGKPNAKVLDVGTGSGAIVLAILKHAPQTTGAAIDISPEALDVARENAATHGLNTRLTCRVGSLLQPLQEGEVYDVITANLPYIPTLDIAGLAPEVRREPVLALDGGADGLDLVRLLVSQAATHLVPGGRLVLEIGAGQGDSLAAWMINHGWNVGPPIRDGGGHWRVVSAGHNAV